MKFIQFKEKLQKLSLFSLADIHILDPGFHRNQLTGWLRQGYIKKLKKGFYFFSDTVMDESFLYIVANKIYSPSYVSLEFSLAHYGFIPESVYAITSISTRKTKTIVTDIGTFLYRNIKTDLMFGYHLEKTSALTYKTASPEKTVLDFLYFNKTLGDLSSIQEMRFNVVEMQSKIDWEKCDRYLVAFNSPTLNNRFQQLKAYIFHA
jgi:predicted transcriptional regulator of viral defense system